MTPALSVVMAVHNGEPYLTAAMDSVLGQTFRDFEFVVIDDCSTDRTPEIVQGYGDPRVVYRRNETNIGQTRSLNVGIEIARAPLIARIDADDLFFPTKLEKQMAYLAANPGVAVLGTASRIIDERDNDLGLVTSPSDEREIRFRLCRGVPVVHISVIMRADALRAVGTYDPGYRYSQDFALWSAFARGGHRITNLAEPLSAFRERADSVNTVNKLGAASDETCRIIQQNARDFAGVELSMAESRAIDLLMFPDAPIDLADIVGAYRNLLRMAGRVWPVVPAKIRAMLYGRLVWAVSKRIEFARRAGRRDFSRAVLRQAAANAARPDVAAGLTTAWAIQGIGFERIGRMKAFATRFLLR